MYLSNFAANYKKKTSFRFRRCIFTYIINRYLLLHMILTLTCQYHYHTKLDVHDSNISNYTFLFNVTRNKTLKTAFVKMMITFN